MPVLSRPEPAVLFPSSYAEAVELLNEGENAAILAGGTWVMRSAARGEEMPDCLVSLDRLEGSRAIVQRDGHWQIGPLASHAAIADRLGSTSPLHALASAALNSANPGVRRLATIGGNLATAEFASPDILTALLALDASVSLQDRQGERSIPIEEFVAMRPLPRGTVVTGIAVPDRNSASSHARLTLRQAGEYPVAIVSVAADLAPDGGMGGVRIAVGSVETAPKRWGDLEARLKNSPLDLDEAEKAARECASSISARDGVDAPAWYRLEALPHLVRSALAEIEIQTRGGKR